MLAAIVLFAAVATRPPSFASPEELNLWLTYYYLQPRPELTLASIPLMDQQLHKATGRSLADQVARGGMRTFYAKVFAQNDAVVQDLARRFRSFRKEQRTFLREALRRCDTAACRRALEQSGPPASGSAASDIEPRGVDDLWAAFAATGDVHHVQEVIAGVVAGTIPRRSLESNAYQHSRVLEACEKARDDSASAAGREALAEIIAAAKANRALSPPPEPR